MKTDFLMSWFMLIMIVGGIILIATHERPDNVFCHSIYGCQITKN